MVVEQHGEQAKFYWRQMDFFFTAHNASRGQVNPDISKRVGWVSGRGCAVAAQRHAKASL